MTKAEYAREYRQARRETAQLTLSGKRKIRREYITVFSRIAKVIRENNHKPFLEEQIRGAFPKQELFNILKRHILEGRGKAVKLITDIDKRHILEALEKVPGHGLSVEKIRGLFDGIAERHQQEGPAVPAARSNGIIAGITAAKCGHGRHTRHVVRNVKERKYTVEPFVYTFHQSYSLSTSVWNTVGDTEDKIMDVVWGGISQGRDVRTVAADLMAYLKGGPEIIKGRWGKLEPGTRDYVKRLGSKGVDYRAMRLYRSELHRHQQEAAVEDGEDNPACTGQYDWILMPGRGVFLCTCPELAKGGPYTKDTIPPYPHSNCDCMVQPEMFSRDEFNQKLKDYVKGEPTEGAADISRWAQKYGLGDDEVVPPPKPDEIEKLLHVTRGAPLSAEEAAKGTNPDYGKIDKKTGKKPFNRNCQRCVPSYELRRRGYEVIALPRLVDGQKDEIKTGVEAFQGVSHKLMGGGKSDLLKELKTFPDGSRFGIIQHWRGKDYGHTYVAEIIKGKIHFIDPQTGEMDVSDNLNRIKIIYGTTLLWYYRMDNAIFNMDILDKIAKGKKPSKNRDGIAQSMTVYNTRVKIMTRDEARKLLEAYHTTDEYGISYYVQVTKFIEETKSIFVFIGHPFSSEDKVDPTFAFEYYVDKITGEISSADSPINEKKLKEMEDANDQP